MKLKVLLYVNCEGGSAGGVQSVVRALRGYLQARGHAVSTGWAQGEQPGGAMDDGWVRQFPVRQDKARWLHLPSAARLIWQLLRERPKVVHLHYASSSALYFTSLARWLPFRVMLTCHGSDILRPLDEDKRYLPRVLGKADLVTAVSEDIASRLRHSGWLASEDIRVIPNGVDTEFWHPKPDEKRANSDMVLLTVGRLEQVKGLDLLVEACAELVAAGRQVRLVIVGDGAERMTLEQQVKAAGIADRVIFAGLLPSAAIREHLHAADLFVLPSRSEGMPLSLLEAMATGTACVAADVGGVSTTAAGAARLVRPEDPQDLAAAIGELIDREEDRLRLGRQARKRALECSIEQTHAAYEAALLELAGAVPGSTAQTIAYEGGSAERAAPQYAPARGSSLPNLRGGG